MHIFFLILWIIFASNLPHLIWSVQRTEFGHKKVQHNLNSVQFAFFLDLRTSKCGLYCWLKESRNCMKAMFVSLKWILHVGNFKSHVFSPDRGGTYLSLKYTSLISYIFPKQLEPIFVRLFKKNTQSFTCLGGRKGHFHSAEKILWGEGAVFYLDSAKHAGEAVFVLDKSHLTAVDRVLTCVGFQASTWGCTYQPAWLG